jgi:hypothetical protein
MLRWREVRLAKTALKFVWPECDSVRLARTDRAAAPPIGHTIKTIWNKS